MWFGILGPLLVRQGDGEVTVAAARQRTLLAALLVNGGKVVSADRLAENVWDGAQPPGAQATLHSYVMRLRKVLGRELGGRIITRSPGYVIHVSAAEMDSLQFRELYRDGAAAVRAGAWRQACDQLEAALRLWRGAPLLDIQSQLVRDAEAPQLEELRLQAQEQTIEAKLHLFQQPDVISELQALTAEHPLREHFHHQLMTALYREARQAEALASYQRLRSRLIDELGIEPGLDLQLLRQRILTADPELLSPARPGPGKPRPAEHKSTTMNPARPVWTPVVPQQLPGATRHFMGRPGALSALTDLMISTLAGTQSVGILAICGVAGRGKTALALHWAHQVAGSFPDGQLYVQLGGSAGSPAGPVAPSQALIGFAEALGISPERVPDDMDARSALFRSLLAGKRVLVILDDAHDVGQVGPLLPGTSGCLTVVTSREQLAGLAATYGARLLTLDGLTDSEACALLVSHLGPRRVRAEPRAVAEIIGLCTRNPLALSIAASRAEACPGMTLAVLTNKLRAEGSDAPEFLVTH
jgi:DNA-binding SARP family transcriptional activator